MPHSVYRDVPSHAIVDRLDNDDDEDEDESRRPEACRRRRSSPFVSSSS
ncbi:unnamed protein product [Strongylus vulgaris]|uniref:Uncharacterized protein n=1 Tax=Strongylus vulgaris TaxID=40348 RepID=A0A3P7IXT3_STRVU|nr:unnamed protein product [Strongylus vulgaris]